MVKQSVVAVSTKQGAWKHNSVERNVVFGHKLVELHFLRVLPPLLPLISVAGSDRQIATDCRYRMCSMHACTKISFHTNNTAEHSIDLEEQNHLLSPPPPKKKNVTKHKTKPNQK